MPGLIQPGSDPASRSLELRPYQFGALDGVRVAFDGGDRSTLVVCPTGTGKTVIFAELVREAVQQGIRVLVLAHRDELLKQARKKLEAVGVWADTEKGKQRASTLAKVVVASVQSLRGKRLERFSPAQFGLIIVDEAHHATATSYRGVLDHFVKARVVGVTATPDRADGTALGEVFQSVAYRYELRQAIADGWLAPIVARRVVVDSVDLSTIHTRAGDLAQNELAEVMVDEEALRGVVVPLLELAQDRRTIVFGVDVDHAHKLAALINTYRPGSARAVDGETDEATREATLAAFAVGEFQYLCNCALFTEGFDEPGVSCVAVVRPTKSRALYTQMIGRGTRLLGLSLDESRANGKHDCLVLDFTGQAGRHRLIGPVDCLAGNDELAEDLRDEIDRLLGSAQYELEDVLQQADDEVSKRRAALAINAVVKYHAEQVDPFLGEDDLDDKQQRFASVPAHWERERATPAQLSALEKLKITKLPPEFTKADASKLLDRLARRRKAGLCSYGQARAIHKTGIDTRQLTFERANELILKLKSNGWVPWSLRGEPEYDAVKKNGIDAITYRDERGVA